MELIEAIRMITEAEKEFDIQFGKDTVLDCATRIYNSGNIEKRKNGDKPAVTDMATAKQQSFLKRLNYKGDPLTLTKKEASKIIDEMVSNEK